MRPWIPAVAALLALASAVTPSALAAQQARGVVVDASTGVPIPEATVTLLDTAAHALGSGRTDGAGVFTILAPAPAPYLVTVRRLGYESFTTPELVLGVRDTTLQIALVPAPQRLAPSVTRGRRGLFAREWGRDGFIRRRELGAGVFLTRFDVLLQEPEYLEEAFRDIEGLQVVGSGTGLQVRSLRGQRCLRVLINRLPLPKPMRGVPQPTGFELLPKHILGIEVYREFDEVPEELRMEAHPCGLINLWTRAAWAPRPPKPTKAGTTPVARP